MTFLQDRSQNLDHPATTLHLLECQCHLKIDVHASAFSNVSTGSSHTVGTVSLRWMVHFLKATFGNSSLNFLCLVNRSIVVQQLHAATQQAATILLDCVSQRLQGVHIHISSYSSLCARYSASRIPWQSQNTVAITLPAYGWTLLLDCISQRLQIKN